MRQASSWRKQCGTEGEGRVHGSGTRSFTGVRNAGLTHRRNHADPLVFLLFISEMPVASHMNIVRNWDSLGDAHLVKYAGVRFETEGMLQIWRKCTCLSPWACSLWRMPVPAEVICKSPRLSTSVFPMESSLQDHIENASKTYCAKDSLSQFSGNDIGEYLKLTMAVGPETGMGLDTVLVHDTEAPKLRVPRVVIACAK